MFGPPRDEELYPLLALRIYVSNGFESTHRHTGSKTDASPSFLEVVNGILHNDPIAQLEKVLDGFGEALAESRGLQLGFGSTRGGAENISTAFQTDTQPDRHTERQTDRRKDRETDTKTDRKRD